MNFYLLLSSGIVGSAPQEIDEYELVDPVDILTPLEKSGFWEGVVSGPLECIFRGNALAFLCHHVYARFRMSDICLLHKFFY